MANGVTAKCLLIVFVAWSAFGSAENKERLKNLKEGFYFKSASYEISHPNWINLLLSSRPIQQSPWRPVFKLNSTLNILMMIIIANDCSTLNPGPTKNPCGVCTKRVRSNLRAIECEECYSWYHKQCLGINNAVFKALENHTSYVWTCCNCGLPSFSSSFFLSDIDSRNRFEVLSDLTSSENGSEPDFTIGSPLHSSSPARPSAKKSKADHLKILNVNFQSLPSKKVPFLAMLEEKTRILLLALNPGLPPHTETENIFLLITRSSEKTEHLTHNE